MEKKAKGLIKHFGFSFHSDPELLDEILTAHPEVDLVQLQINYADWENPKEHSRGNYEVARKPSVSSGTHPQFPAPPATTARKAVPSGSTSPASSKP